MITHYVYVLYFKGRPIYVGISFNPATRIYQHMNDYRFTNIGVKKVSDITVKIVDKLTTKTTKKTIQCHVVEQYWIHKYLKNKHKLINKLLF